MSIGADLLRYSDRKLIIPDFETQRLNLMQDNLPFQLAWIVSDKTGILERHNYYFHWPNFRMSPDAAKITRFNPEWVKNGTDPEFILNAFESYLFNDKYDIASQNWLGFDIYIHKNWREALGKKPDYSYKNRVYDTNVLAKAYKLGIKPDRTNLLAWQYKLVDFKQRGLKTNLGGMAKELGMEVEEGRLHEAGYDLEVNDFVHRKLINMIEI